MKWKQKKRREIVQMEITYKENNGWDKDTSDSNPSLRKDNREQLSEGMHWKSGRRANKPDPSQKNMVVVVVVKLKDINLVKIYYTLK